MDPTPRSALTTRLLRRFSEGDRDASAEAFALLYDELRAMARRATAGRPPEVSPEATELVHELWIRLGASPKARIESHAHFLGIAARVMRGLLVDRARRAAALRRGGATQRSSIDAALVAWEQQCDVDVLDLDELLTRLERRDPRLAAVVQLRFFAGLDQAGVAGALGLTERQVGRSWDLARAWLARELGRGSGGNGT